MKKYYSEKQKAEIINRYLCGFAVYSDIKIGFPPFTATYVIATSVSQESQSQGVFE